MEDDSANIKCDDNQNEQTEKDTNMYNFIDNILQHDDFDISMDLITQQIQDLQVPAEQPTREPVKTIEVPEFDASNNILDYEVRERFRNELIYDETEIFSEPISTTNTMEGYISNVSFHERDFIGLLNANEDIVIFRCNYGESVYEGYTKPVKIRTTNRGRKKKTKQRNLRKKQGSGIDFNSQITFMVRSTMVNVTDGVVPLGSQIYKFKIFRTGKLQLPGVHKHLVDDVIKCTNIIVRTLNQHLHPNEADLTKISTVININPVMKNYKFIVKVPQDHILDLMTLRTILFNERSNPPPNPTRPSHPRLFMVKYSRQETKLSIKFSTPIPRKPKKKTRVNIFLGGKINILGAFSTETTTQICDYLHWIFETNFDVLVVRNGERRVIEKIPLVDNIASLEPNFENSIMDYFRYFIPGAEHITDEIALEIMEIVDKICENVNDELEDAIRWLLSP